VNRTPDGFPYLPGRTIKGLLREAAEVIRSFDTSLVGEHFLRDVFGQHPAAEVKPEGAAPAQCFFTNAVLPERVRGQIAADDLPYLYHILASTRLDDQGMAAAGTLRQLEVTVPMTLEAAVHFFPEEKDYEKQLSYCFQWVKRIGLNRSRGLGRCKFSIVNSRT
jgi:CRISPR/Cas system CSM-associated protein Csm3 (group 7 of RAMP superfamily)